MLNLQDLSQLDLQALTMASTATGSTNRLQQMSFNWSACDDDSPSAAQGGKRTKMSHTPSSTHIPLSTASTTITSWDIDGGLAADFDGSLSGLGSELGSGTYNMSEALLALPVFKQENLDNGFQYVLGAATSPAIKINEETLTYLNQGQSYEIKVKKLGDLSELQGKLLCTTVKVCFHERRLQYMEREQLESWMQNRPGERIMEIDIPLSHGLVNVVTDPKVVNSADFIWDPTKETGVYIRVHCISTEFTAKKHGGEKGVPFRIQIETRTHDEEPNKLLHCASCQIKVFKPKGADRKLKTDREKMDKRPESEKEKFQPSYDCTVLTEIPLDQVLQSYSGSFGIPSVGSFGSLAQAYKEQSSTTQRRSPPESWQWQQSSMGGGGSPPGTVYPPTAPSPTARKAVVTTSPTIVSSPQSPSHDSNSPCPLTANVPNSLAGDASAKDVTQWLQVNRFSSYIRVFQNFSGADLLRLTRDDLIQICGLADGIRLNNALQSRSVRPRLTLYICRESDTVYHAVYMEKLTSAELVQKVTDLFNIQASQVRGVFILGPSSIHIQLTDEVVRNLPDQARFWLDAVKDSMSAYGDPGFAGHRPTVLGPAGVEGGDRVPGTAMEDVDVSPAGAAQSSVTSASTKQSVLHANKVKKAAPSSDTYKLLLKSIE